MLVGRRGYALRGILSAAAAVIALFAGPFFPADPAGRYAAVVERVGHEPFTSAAFAVPRDTGAVEIRVPSNPVAFTVSWRCRPVPSIHWMTSRPSFLVRMDPLPRSYRRPETRAAGSPLANERTASGSNRKSAPTRTAGRAPVRRSL